MFDVLTIGNATQDIFLFPRVAEVRDEHSKKHPFPELCFVHGSKISVDRVEERIGGNAANAAVALVRLNHSVTASLFVGGDDWGEQILKTLIAEGVDTSHIFREQKARSAFSTLIVYEGERTILSFHGANIDFSKQAKKLPRKKVARWIYLTSVAGDWEAVYRYAVGQAAEHSVALAMNPGLPQLEAGLEQLRGPLSVTRVLFVNREEALKLTRLPPLTKLEELAAELRRFGPKLVIVTDGPAGATAVDEGATYHHPAFPGERFEPTGAGDSYAAGVLGRLLFEDHGLVDFSEASVREALAWGATNAASVVETIGPQEGLLRRSEIEARLKKERGFVVRSTKR